MNINNILNSKLKMMILSHQNKEFEKAKRMAQSLIKDFPKVNISWKILTDIHLHNKEFDDALKAIQKAIDINPDDAEAHNIMCLIFTRLKKFNNALECIEKAIELKPDKADFYFNMTVLLRNLNQLEKAEKKCRKAIELKPNFIEAYSNLGIILHKLNRLDEAEVNYRKAIEINPNYLSAKNNLDTLNKQKKLLNIINIKKKTNSNYVNNLFKTNRKVENNLIQCLYNIKTKTLNDIDPEILRYGNGVSSDYNLFENDINILKEFQRDLTDLIKKVLSSDIYILESFFNIFKEGSGIVKHNHVTIFDEENSLTHNKYSLVYYLSVGDQTVKEPGILTLYNPEIEILPTDGMLMIFPANRFHTSKYSGKKDRVMIGVNFYTIN